MLFRSRAAASVSWPLANSAGWCDRQKVSARHLGSGGGRLEVICPLAPTRDSSHEGYVTRVSSLCQTYRFHRSKHLSRFYDVAIHLSFCDMSRGLNNRRLPHGRRKRDDPSRIWTVLEIPKDGGRARDRGQILRSGAARCDGFRTGVGAVERPTHG